MSDEPKNPTPPEAPKNEPVAPVAPVDKKLEAPSGPDVTKMAEDLGMVRKENETLKDYQARVNPVIETIWSDPELLKQVESRHKKRLGIVDAEETSKDLQKQTPSATDVDTRNAVIKRTVDDFSDKYGISKMESKEKQDMNTRVGTMLKDLLDPRGNKRDLAEVMQDVSLTKLPFYLEQAYFLANKDNIVAAAKEQAKKEIQDASLGVMGSFSSTSIEPDSMTLSAREKDIADNMGVTHEQYLKNKKEIAKRNNNLV